MYNLNYTYLTDLEVDTRQSFADLFDDLTLLDKSNRESYKENAETLISSWQSFFWHSNNSNKQKLKVTFTDISVYHNPPSGDIPGSKEIMTFGELEAIYNSLENHWPNNMTFAQFTKSLVNAIDRVQQIMINDDHSYPVKSMVINDTNPAGSFGYTWEKQPAVYLGERRDMVGYQSGSFSTLDGTVILPSSVDGLIPKHEHDVEFLPTASGGGSNDQSATESTECAVWDSYGDPGSGYGDKSSCDNKTRPAQIKHSGGADGNGGCDAGNPWTDQPPRQGGTNPEDPKTTYDVGGTVTSKSGRDLPDDTKYGVKIAPNTYPISNAHVWERTR